MGKRVLMVAFHYPPAHGFSGTQRGLKFSRYLPEFGWQPLVLSAHPRAYPDVSQSQMGEIPPDVVVERAFALDAVRHLAIKGRYSRLTALPDRWAAWWLGAIPAGLRLIRKHRPAVIWSTYPTATAHLIAWTLSRLSGLPWVADFRDTMVIEKWPQDPWVRRVFNLLEPRYLDRCRLITVTNPGIQRLYQARYPQLAHDKWRVITNGFDDADFAHLPAPSSRVSKRPNTPWTWVHSGRLYPGLDSRDPSVFLEALGRLKQQGVVTPERLQIILRATDMDESLRPLIQRYQLENIVTLAPLVPYSEAVDEMGKADALLLFQGHDFNHLIPAKLFEYFRARRPVLALVGEGGDAAGVLQEAGYDLLAPLDDRSRIQSAIERLLEQLEQGGVHVPEDEVVQRYSRRAGAGQLADVLEYVAEG
ncbi:MAG: glycosyltransferase [Magnetococcales bacterium]|nr:glycosyltransferase [Magnetococcales bacterium]